MTSGERQDADPGRSRSLVARHASESAARIGRPQPAPVLAKASTRRGAASLRNSGPGAQRRGASALRPSTLYARKRAATRQGPCRCLQPRRELSTIRVTIGDQALPPDHLRRLRYRSEAVDHLRVRAVLGRRRLRSRSSSRARLRRIRLLAGSGASRSSATRAPRSPPDGIGRAPRQQALVVGERGLSIAVLLLGQRQPEARLVAARLELRASSRRRARASSVTMPSAASTVASANPASRRTVSPQDAHGARRPRRRRYSAAAWR